MSNRPVGRDVYWRRRLLVLAVLLGLAWGVVQAISLMRGDDTEKTAATKPMPTTAAPVTTATTEPPADQVAVAIDTAATACEPENVRIVPSVRSGQFAGGPINIDLMVTALDGKACTFQPSADELLVVVDTERAPIYDSSVCRAAFFQQSVAVPEGWGTVASVDWSGRGSGTGCGTSEGFAPAGTYTLKIGTYGGEPGETTFRLQRRAPETPAPTTQAPTAEPTATPSKKPTPKRPKATSTAE